MSFLINFLFLYIVFIFNSLNADEHPVPSVEELVSSDGGGSLFFAIIGWFLMFFILYLIVKAFGFFVKDEDKKD